MASQRESQAIDDIDSADDAFAGSGSREEAAEGHRPLIQRGIHATMSCEHCRVKKKRCFRRFEDGDCDRCVAEGKECIFATIDRRRKTDKGSAGPPSITPLDAAAQGFVKLFFCAQRYKTTLVPEVPFVRAVDFYSSRTAPPRQLSVSGEIVTIVDPPLAPGWFIEPLSPDNAPTGVKVLLFCVLAIGAAMSGMREKAAAYHAAAEALLSAATLFGAPTPPVVSALLALGHLNLSHGLGGDRSRSAFFYGMAASKATSCPHLDPSVRLATFLITDDLVSRQLLPSGSSSNAPMATIAGSSLRRDGGAALSGLPSLSASSLHAGGGHSSADSFLQLATAASEVNLAVLSPEHLFPLPLLEARAARTLGIAAEMEILQWLPSVLLIALMRQVNSAKERSATPAELSAGLLVFGIPFTGNQRSSLVFALVAQLVLAIHGPVKSTCGSRPVQKSGADAGAPSASNASAMAVDSAEPPSAPLAGQEADANGVAGPTPALCMCAASPLPLGSDAFHPSASLLLPAALTLLDLLKPISVEAPPRSSTGADAYVPLSAASSVLPWHLLISAGLSNPSSLASSSSSQAAPMGPIERAAHGASHFGRLEALIRDGTKAAMCALLVHCDSARSALPPNQQASVSIAAASRNVDDHEELLGNAAAVLSVLSPSDPAASAFAAKRSRANLFRGKAEVSHEPAASAAAGAGPLGAAGARPNRGAPSASGAPKSEAAASKDPYSLLLALRGGQAL